MPSPVAAVAVVTSMFLLVTGCSGGGTPSASPEPGPTPSTAVASAAASPSPAATAPPSLPAPSRPADRRGPAGQEAFARYVMQLWGTALNEDDARPLLRLSPGSGSCAGCAALGHELRDRLRHGWYVDFPGLVVHRVRLSADGPVTVAAARVDVPGSTARWFDGAPRTANPAHPGATFTVRMRWVGDGWRLAGFSLA